MKKRFYLTRFRFLVACLVLLVLASCNLTKSLWYGKNYEDKIRSFLVTSDGRQVVFIGEKYHYIFIDQSNMLKQLLLWKDRKSIYIDLNNSKIELDNLNNVKGYVIVRAIYSDLEVQKYSFLTRLGFVKGKDGSLSGVVYLSGKRYLPARNVRFYTSALNLEYKFKINYESNSIGKIGKVALTPITAAIDATLFIGKIPLSIW